MNRWSLKAAVLAPSLAVLAAGVIVMAIVAGMLSSNTTDDLTNQLIEAKIHEYTNEFKDLCGGVYDALSAVTPIVAKYADPGLAVSDRRGEVIDILSRALISSDKIIAIWTCWEPDAFDGKDSEYANVSFYDQTGRFVPYLYKDGSGYDIDALADYEHPVDGMYYRGARDSGRPYITDPYDYQVGNKKISICSLAIPITIDGKTAGVVGVDIDLQDFMTLMNGADILDDGYMFTLSPGGLLASHPNVELQTTSYKDSWMNDYSPQLESIFTGGGRFAVTSYSNVINSEVDLLGIGVMVGDTGRYWLVCGAVPKKTVEAYSVSLIWAIILIGVVLIAVIGTTIFLLFHHKLKGLPKLTKAAEDIAAGSIDMSGLSNGTEHTGNEITLLERAFFKMGDGIRRQADVLSKISDGDYSVSIPVRSDKDVINQAIGHVLDSTNSTLTQINTAAGQVSAGSRQIAESAQSLAKGAAEQASAIEELSVSVSDITGKTDENAKIAAEAALLSKTIKEKAEKGNAQMEQMMQAVNEITEASFQIEKVLKAIDEIAFQTNILALNAAVEAARAGQHGKGFAVVAEEVRSLAAKSAASANDTGGMIKNAKDKADLGRAIAAETSKSLRDIIEGVNRSADIVAQIERGAKEQAAAISEINAGIGHVSQVIQQNSSASEESAAASEQMNVQSQLLTHLTSQFILKE